MSLIDDLRRDLGDDDNVPVVMPPAATGVFTLTGLLRDLRADIGADSPLLDVGAPEIWGVVSVTSNSYSAQQTDVIILVCPTISGPTLIELPATPVVGQLIIVKDKKGDANVNNITIDPPGATTIDGFNQFLITQRYQSFTFVWNGTEWNAV
jgi:hypothetical protein